MPKYFVVYTQSGSIQEPRGFEDHDKAVEWADDQWEDRDGGEIEDIRVYELQAPGRPLRYGGPELAQVHVPG